MNHYRLLTPKTTHLLIVKDGNLIYSDPAVYHDLAGRPLPFVVAKWTVVRGSFEAVGYHLVPLIDHVSIIEYKDKKYAFLWKDDDLIRITMSNEDETRDITWRELPWQLQGVLL